MTPLMERILHVLQFETEGKIALPPNTIGYKALGRNYEPVHGNGRVFGPAQRIIFPLNRLKELGYVDFCSRPDGMSGTAYFITDDGLDALNAQISQRRENTPNLHA